MTTIDMDRFAKVQVSGSVVKSPFSALDGCLKDSVMVRALKSMQGILALQRK